MPTLTFHQKPEPLLPQVVEFLTENWNEGLLDLSNSILILPTQESRRRLHEALIRKAATRDSALLPPLWMLPMNLPEGKNFRFASSSMEQLSWIEVISGMSTETKHQIFPRNAPPLDFSHAAEFANILRKLRSDLAQSGITLSEAVRRHPEELRWKALLCLEELYLGILAKAEVTDRISAQLSGALNPTLPPGVRRLLIAGVPDLPKIYDSMIPQLEKQGIPVEILIHDPLGKGAEFYDALGRPTERWTREPIEIAPHRIHLCMERAEEAEKAAALAKASGGNGSHCAVAVTSHDLAQNAKEELENQKIKAFNPAGQSLDSMSMGRLLQVQANLLKEGDFQSALQIIRHPDIQRWLELQPACDLKTLDDLQKQLIPSSLADLIDRWPDQKPERLLLSLKKLQSLLTELQEGLGTSPLLKMLREIYGPFDLGKIPGGSESAERIRECLSGAESKMEQIASTDLLHFLIASLRDGSSTGEKKPGSVELPGWLELLWEDAPHLIVIGMNDGLVPEMRKGDSFLSERLRKEWKLPSDETRLARDSYLLLSMIAARPETTGRVDLLVARHDAEGSVLKPSRLLLRCAEESELPGRVKELFQEIRPQPGKEWQSAWVLKPDRIAPPLKLSASALKEYLACPARFYLKRLLGMQKEEFDHQEADSASFGELLHETLQQFGSDPALSALCEEHQIEKALHSLWKKNFSAHFGTSPLFPLVYQREVGMRRLTWVAREQAINRAEGWQIMACEKIFANFRIGGMNFSGRIDRIDRRVTPSGQVEWRIIDYKSSRSAATPDEEHYRPLKKREMVTDFPPYECFELNGKTYRWRDLQLPLYQLFFLHEMKRGSSAQLGLNLIEQGAVDTAYFLLPSELEKTKLSPFQGFDCWEQSALRCLERVAAAIGRGIFWPPRKPDYDDFSGLLFDHLDAPPDSKQRTLDHTALEPLKEI